MTMLWVLMVRITDLHCQISSGWLTLLSTQELLAQRRLKLGEDPDVTEWLTTRTPFGPPLPLQPTVQPW